LWWVEAGGTNGSLASPFQRVLAAFRTQPSALGPSSFQVVFLGLYNGQRLEAEPASDVVTYSRIDEVGACLPVRFLVAEAARNL